MMARSLAEHYRAHRQAFTLALEKGCTPREAEAELARRAAHDRWKNVAAKCRAKRSQSEPSIATDIRAGHEPEETRGPWWQWD